MRTIEVTTTIHAPAATVWSIVGRSDAYQEWNPFITPVSGAREEGARPRLRRAPPERRAMSFRPLVTDATPEPRLAGAGKLGVRRLCAAQHELPLEPCRTARPCRSNGRSSAGCSCRCPAACSSRPDAGFEAMNTALRVRAEQTLAAR